MSDMDTSEGPGIELDLRRLPPPEPLLRIHEALLDLPPRGRLIAHTPRRPGPLLDWLPANGYSWRLREHPSGEATVWIACDGQPRN